MSIYLELDPKLKLTPKDFAEAWNASPECQQAGKASLEQQPSASFMDPALAEAGMLLLEGVLMGVMGGLVTELIKEVLFKQGVRKKVMFIVHSLPDGKQVVVVVVEEE